ncbi:MAG TPA: ABC transporter permease [Planctomycetaceae bacterium]|nr:ABC transporter permease [Planctomycetaceae bacterium]
MSWLAWRMLIGDRTKYWGIVFGVAFGSLLIAQQSAIFVGLMRRTSSRIIDVTEADIWVMDKQTLNVDEVRPMPENRLYQVRGVPGVEWAVRLFKGQVVVRTEDGGFRQVFLVGVDDGTLIGTPHELVLGSAESLREPDAIIVDQDGYKLLFPDQPLRLGAAVQMNDRRAVVAGICRVSPPFTTLPVIYTRYSRATVYAPHERNMLSFVLAGANKGTDPAQLCSRIAEQTSLKAMTSNEFLWFNVGHYLRNTGIPVNFGITVGLGFVVGAAIAGQTFYLFTLENLKQFGSLKAMGVTNSRLIGMVLLQAVAVGVMGFGIGIGLAAAFFETTERLQNVALRGMYLPWQVVAVTGVAVGLIVFLASILSLRRVLVLEPGMVFK